MSDITPQNNPPPKKIPPEIIQEAIRRFRCESLGEALMFGVMEALIFFLENGADPNQPWRKDAPPPIIFAIRYGQFEDVKILIKYHANIEVRGRYNQTPLIAAAETAGPSNILQFREKCVTIAKFLLENGANIEAKDDYGKTPMIAAVVKGNIQMTQFLLENGANIEAKDNSDRTPLIRAVTNGNIQITQLLLDNGANIEAKDNSDRTPLIWAVIRYNEQPIIRYNEQPSKYEQMIKLLIQHGANPNVSDNSGKTPIQIATENGNIQIVELLLKHGANQNVSDNSGKTPIQIATENNRQDLIDLFNDYTSQTTSTALNSPPHTNNQPTTNQALPLEREGGPVANTTGDRMKREHRSRKKSAKQLRNRVSPHKKTKFYIDEDGNPISASEKRNLEAKIRKDEIEGRCADIFFGRMLRVRRYGKPPEDESITPNEIFPREFRIFCFPRRKRTKLPLPKKPRGLTPPLPKKPPPLKKRIPKIYYSNGYFRVRKKQGRYTIKIMPPTEKKQINIGIKLMKMLGRQKKMWAKYLADSRRKNRLEQKRQRQQQKEEQKRQRQQQKEEQKRQRLLQRQQQKEEQKRQRQQQKEEQKRQQQKPPPQLPPPNNPDAP